MIIIKFKKTARTLKPCYDFSKESFIVRIVWLWDNVTIATNFILKTNNLDFDSQIFFNLNSKSNAKNQHYRKKKKKLHVRVFVVNDLVNPLFKF